MLLPSGRITRIGSILQEIYEGLFKVIFAAAHVKGSSQYSENMVARMLTTMPSFVSSSAVTSINTLRVLTVILECSELMMGGILATVRLLS